MIRLVGMLAGVALALLSGPLSAQVKEVRMIEAGGLSGDSIEKGYIEPFTAKSGIKVVRENPNPFGRLRALVESGKITASLFEVGSGSLAQAKALGLIEPLDWDAVAPKPMFPEAKDPMGFGYQYYSVIMAWRSDAKAPKNWVDFWNVKDFPGKRSLPDNPNSALPLALIADGVPLDKVFPVDLDRAFASLNKIKKDVAVWWKAGAQPPQLLKDNEVQYAAVYSGRVFGQPGIASSFEQGLLDLAYFVVPKGANPEEKKAAMKLLHEMSVPENQVKAVDVVPYPGSSPELPKLLTPEKLAVLPTSEANKAKQFIQNAEFWFKNADAVQKRWEEFKLSL